MSKEGVKRERERERCERWNLRDELACCIYGTSDVWFIQHTSGRVDLKESDVS